jgi:hypothetical protein
MKVKISVSFLFFFVVGIINVFSQTYTRPNVALKSHATLEITSVEITSTRTVVYLSIENRVEGGNFCADKNISLTDAEGRRLNLITSSGIPVCPEAYKFKSIGEKRKFTLEFPPLKAGTKWIDIEENCSDNCFSFYGVTLITELNMKIEEALAMAESGETTRAISFYKGILSGLGDSEKGIKGGIYTDIITLLLEKGDKTGAREWYNKMADSGIPRLELYIRNLNSRGIKY